EEIFQRAFASKKGNGGSPISCWKKEYRAWTVFLQMPVKLEYIFNLIQKQAWLDAYGTRPRLLLPTGSFQN
ncbi:MAG: hypothetical protein B6245_17455, partial [Desulfobacteraceae bacterium 4572_88]